MRAGTDVRIAPPSSLTTPNTLSVINSRKRQLIVDGYEFESIGSAASAFGVSRNTVDYRLSKGWTPEEAVGVRPRPDHAASTPGLAVKVQGLEFASIRQAAKHFGRSYTHIFARLNEGCTLEQALGLVKRTDSLQSVRTESVPGRGFRETNRSYHIDEANSFGEPPHVDVNRLRTHHAELLKKKYPFGD